MKKLRLLCNAHIDPVWLWQCNEGIAAILSTFCTAADLWEGFDGSRIHARGMLGSYGSLLGRPCELKYLSLSEC